MPETTVDENSQPSRWKAEIWLPENFKVSPPAFNSELSEKLDKLNFRVAISFGANRAHYGRSLFWRENVGHSREAVLCFWFEIAENDAIKIGKNDLADAVF